MKKIALILIVCALASCGASDVPQGRSSLMCVSIEAAALVTWFSTTTLVEGVIGPIDSNGDPVMTSDELAAAMAVCFADPQSQLLIEAIQAAQAIE